MTEPPSGATQTTLQKSSKMQSSLWFRRGMDAIAIVTSILLAFAIDAWWADRLRSKEVQQIFAGLETEFQTYQETLIADGELWEEAVTRTEWLLNLTQSHEVPDVSEMDMAFGWSLHASTFDARSGTRDALLSSGRLQLIRNPELRVLLASSPHIIDNIVENETTTRFLVEQRLLPYLTEKGIPPKLMVEHWKWVPEEQRRATIPDLPSDDNVIREVYREILADQEFALILARKYHWMMVTLVEYRTAQEAVANILKRIAEERMS